MTLPCQVPWQALLQAPCLILIYKEALESKAVTDPRAAVVVDVATLKATPGLPGEWLVSGLVYDVATGLVETILPPTPLRATSGVK